MGGINLCAAVVLSIGASSLLFSAAVAQTKVVELFTSQACPACRPAEALIERLADRKDILALAFHVDYWNYTGWTDPYSNRAYTTRQQAYLKKSSQLLVATPQFVINGRSNLVGSSTDWVERMLTSEAIEIPDRPKLDIRLVERNVVRIDVGPAKTLPRASVLLVQFTPSLRTKVTTGDNAGRQLTNTNVVRGLRSVALYEGRPLALTVPTPDLDKSRDRIAVILQEIDLGPIIGAMVLNR